MTLPQNHAVPRSFADTALRPREFALLLLQLALLTVLVWQFHLEEKRHLLAALVVAGGGFAVHVWLPAAHRRLWFLTVSAAHWSWCWDRRKRCVRWVCRSC